MSKASFRIVVAGDSIGAGSVDGADPWTGLNLGRPYEVDNHSFGGAYLDQMANIDESAVLSDYTSAYGSAGCWLVIQAGTNDLSQGATPQAMYADVAKLVHDAHAAGFQVVVSTILPRDSSVYAWSAVDETARLQYNDLVRANQVGADAIADIAADPTMGSSTAPFNSSLYIDGLHPTATAVATYLQPIYAAALLSQSSGTNSAPVTSSADTLPEVSTIPEPSSSSAPVVTPSDSSLSSPATQPGSSSPLLALNTGSPDSASSAPLSAPASVILPDLTPVLDPTPAAITSSPTEPLAATSQLDSSTLTQTGDTGPTNTDTSAGPPASPPMSLIAPVLPESTPQAEAEPTVSSPIVVTTEQGVSSLVATSGPVAPDATSVAGGNLLVNGSFELGPTDGPFTTVESGSNAISGWIVTKGDVDDVNTYWRAADGGHSLDLNGDEAGAVAQTFTTVAGQEYDVSFEMAGNPDDPTTATHSLQVSAAGSLQDFTFDSVGQANANMGWAKENFQFTATGASTTLSFSGLNDSYWGAALDDVSVTPAPTSAAANNPSSAPTSGNLLVNGSFEAGPSNQGFVTVESGSNVIAGWTVTNGDVDDIHTYWQSADGGHSLDMNGNTAGSIAQTFSTVAGQQYEADFMLAGNPDDPTTQLHAVQVSAAGSYQNFTFDSSGRNDANMGWTPETFDFTATGSTTTLEFSGLNNRYWGAALDNVSVRMVGALP